MAQKASHSNILGRSIVKYGDSQEKVRRLQFGLGAPPGDLKAAEKCVRCSFGNIPVIEEVVWTIPLPLTPVEAQATFGETVNLLSGSSSVPGVASIDSTFLINGILQTDILAQGVGVHVFCEPISFSTIGNAFESPAVQVPNTPPSPDVFTLNDLGNGALGPQVGNDPASPNFFPAVFEFGGPAWRAGWNFINAYQFQWKTSQRELVLNELAADVSYFGSFADAEASGTSEVPIIEYVALVNAVYRSKNSETVFLPVSFRRVGSVTTADGNVGVFHPTRDFDLAPVTWGGLRWQGYGCRGQMYRPVESPCFLERGIPIGMLFVTQDAVHQAQMLESLTIDNQPFGVNLCPDENLGAGTSSGVVPPNAGNNTMLEQTLDAVPANVPQIVNVCRQVFKGGILKIAIKIKGWEMPGGWKAFCQKEMPQIMSPSPSA
jgi:hypothetical protein